MFTVFFFCAVPVVEGFFFFCEDPTSTDLDRRVSPADHLKRKTVEVKA